MIERMALLIIEHMPLLIIGNMALFIEDRTLSIVKDVRKSQHDTKLLLGGYD